MSEPQRIADTLALHPERAAQLERIGQLTGDQARLALQWASCRTPQLGEVVDQAVARARQVADRRGLLLAEMPSIAEYLQHRRPR